MQHYIITPYRPQLNLRYLVAAPTKEAIVVAYLARQ